MKPVLFNTEMVRAILDGRKTETRRVVKLKYCNTHLTMRTDKYGTRLIELQNEEPGVTTVRNPDGTTTHKLLAAVEKTPPYRPGDILYVRETWYKDAGRYMYKANYADNEKFYINGRETSIRWRPSIHMPKEAARLFLRVKAVQVERLHDMTANSAMDEGFTDWNDLVRCWDSTIRPADRALYGWGANPWVWVIEFERVTREEAENG